MKYIIGLGGSIMCPDEINTDYLRRFSQFIKEQVRLKNKFIIITGGGITARNYQRSALKLNISSTDRDWLGIRASQLNAQLLNGLFDADITLDRIKSFKRKPILIGAGQIPGRSTDWVAVRAAVDLNIKEVLLLGKPDYVYTSDFEKDKKAKPIEKITFNDYFKIIPSKWQPGLSVPIDPIAARLAQKEGIKVIVAQASNLNNLKKILENKKFKGTTITT